MIVFKNYFKIVKKHFGFIIMFASISIGIAVANTTYNATEEYTSIKPKLGIINYDDSNISKSFTKYLEENAEISEVSDDLEEIQDTLYLNKVDAILIIPKTFGDDIINGNESGVRVKKSIQSTSEYTELLVNRYLKVAYTYSQVNMKETEIIKNLEDALKNEVEVKISSEQKYDLDKLAVFYSFENYAFLSILIFIIGTIMCIFNQEVIQKRNSVSSLKQNSFSNQLFLGHITLAIILWFVFVVISVLIYKDLMFTMNGLLLVINSLCFTFTVTSLAYLISTFVKNANILSGVQNVLGLGLSFISGCFVPIELLDQNIIHFSKLFPSYWFIQTNYDITALSSFEFDVLKPIIQNYLIIILFGIIYFIIGKIVKHIKKI